MAMCVNIGVRGMSYIQNILILLFGCTIYNYCFC